MAEAEVRHKRLCDQCGQLDDHPRHTWYVPPGTPGTIPTDEFLASLPDGCPATAIAELMDPTSFVRHIDCCAATGCAICTATEQVTGGVRGDELVAILTSGAVDGMGTDTYHSGGEEVPA